MTNKRSRVTSILADLADKNKCDFSASLNEPDSGYVLGRDGSRRYFSYGTIDLNRCASAEFAQNKAVSSEMVAKIGVRCPKELVFNAENHIDFKEVMRAVGIPAMIKPMLGAQGKDILRIDSAHDFSRFIEKIGFKNERFVIQEFIDSPHEIRVVLLDGDIIQAYERDYAHVIGDGTKSVRQLISDKNDYFHRRERNTVIDMHDLQIADILRKTDRSLDSILPMGERLNISYGRNLSRGGEYEFIDNRISPKIKSVCEKIAKASSLRIIGIDLFILGDIASLSNENEVIFIEYNASPDMENNFYYDNAYGERLYKIYEKIFQKIIE